MPTFYYQKEATLHLCNKQLYCSQNSYMKLCKKEKITEFRLRILSLLNAYRILTEDMIAVLTGHPSNLHTELDSLSEYGLIIKQFYECNCKGEMIRTHTFYSVSACLPFKINQTWNTGYKWDTHIKMEDAMSILAFNHFHLALCSSIPKKHLQAQTTYQAGGVVVDGQYKLKSRKYYLGYSLCIAIAVRDISTHNIKIHKTLDTLRQHYNASFKKMPWFILICENELQCAHINQRLMTHPDLKKLTVFFILDTDIEYDENPLSVLQKYRIGVSNEVISETYCIKNWY